MSSFFFFNDTATTEIYTLSLHDALPISSRRRSVSWSARSSWATRQRLPPGWVARPPGAGDSIDRKSTRLNSSHGYISYAVFCLKKKKNTTTSNHTRPTQIPSLCHKWHYG